MLYQTLVATPNFAGVPICPEVSIRGFLKKTTMFRFYRKIIKKYLGGSYSVVETWFQYTVLQPFFWIFPVFFAGIPVTFFPEKPIETPFSNNSSYNHSLN